MIEVTELTTRFILDIVEYPLLLYNLVDSLCCVVAAEENDADKNECDKSDRSDKNEKNNKKDGRKRGTFLFEIQCNTGKNIGRIRRTKSSWAD